MRLTRHQVECIYIFNNKDLTGVDLTYVDLTGANLTYVDLGGANLSYANLSGANLIKANLSGANLSYANLYYTVGNGKELITIQTNYYTLTMTKDIIQIGCMVYTYEEWLNFSDTVIKGMDSKALEFWQQYKDIVLQMHCINFTGWIH